MNIKLCINCVCVDLVELKAERCKEDCYLKAVERLLRLRNLQKLNAAKAAGTFYIEVLSVV